MGSTSDHDEADHSLLPNAWQVPVTRPGFADKPAEERSQHPRVFLIRHAHEDGPKDPDRGKHLSDLGQRQAYALARRMADWQLDAIICSDTFRASETAAAVRAFHPDIPLVVDSTFREVSRGRLAAFERGDPEQSGLGQRLEAAWNKIVTMPYHSAAVIIHNGMISYLLGRAVKYERHPKPPFYSSLTGVTAIQVKTKGRADLRFFNDTRHLTPELLHDEKTWIEDAETGRWCFGVDTAHHR